MPDLIIILVHFKYCSSTCSPSPRKLEKVKARKIESVTDHYLPFPCTCEHSKLHRVEKKIPRARSYHFCKNFWCRSICFALKQWRKIDGSTVLFPRKGRQQIMHKNYIPTAKQYMYFVQILPHKQTVWQSPSLTQSFNHRASRTKQLFNDMRRFYPQPRSHAGVLTSFFKTPLKTPPCGLHKWQHLFSCSLRFPEHI